jgi:hypothetical protein
MTLFEQLLEIYPELVKEDFEPIIGTISLCDDSDGLGAYIEKWEYSKPIPDGMKLGK